MSAGLFKAPTSNYWSSSLNGAIDDSVDTITLNDTTGLQYPGYVVIDREDGNGTATANSREIVKYTGISGNDLTGCTRAADNSTARSHSDGALVEAVFTVGMHNDQRDAINAEHDTDGTHTIISSVTITTANIGTLTAPSVTLTNPVGIKGHFLWTKSGSLATVRHAVATDTHMPLMRATHNSTINGVYLSLLSAPSTAPVEVDVTYSSGATGDFTSIFSTRPFVDIGEPSTTSSATPGTLSLTSLASGTFLRAEILQAGGAGTLSIQLPVTSRA